MGIYRANERLLLNQISWGTLFARIFGPARCVNSFKGEVFEYPTDIVSTENPFIYRSHLFLKHNWAVGKYGVSRTIATDHGRYTWPEWRFMGYEGQARTWHNHERNANGKEPGRRWRHAQRGAMMSDELADTI
jgi:hypothetical protein